MPKLLIELSGTEYDRLVAYARTLRRTPQQQAAQIVADAMAELADLDALLTEPERAPRPALAPEEGLGPVQAGRDRP